MTEKAIDQAFEGRWRIKAENKPVAYVKGVKDLCRDFFTAGILIAEEATVPEVSTSGNCMMTVKEAVTHTKELRFETWWELYDLKCNRKDCLKKWLKLSLDEIDACIDSTPAYVASTPDKQYRKRPLTYLNQKAWNDEIIPRNNGNTKPTIEQQRLDKLADILAG